MKTYLKYIYLTENSREILLGILPLGIQHTITIEICMYLIQNYKFYQKYSYTAKPLQGRQANSD